MKKLIGMAGIMLLLAGWPAVGLSMDFAGMSNVELFDLRGAIRNAPEADRNAYQAEWEKRLAGMSEEEKQLYAEAEASDQKEKDDDLLDQPRIPARGYENQGIPGQIIFGGYPEGGGAGK